MSIPTIIYIQKLRNRIIAQIIRKHKLFGTLTERVFIFYDVNKLELIMDNSDSVYVITGATHGLGRACAIELAQYSLGRIILAC